MKGRDKFAKIKTTCQEMIYYTEIKIRLLHTLHTYTTTFIQRGVQEVGLWAMVADRFNTKYQNRTLHGVCFRVTWYMNHL